jgi:glycosyltransferase involved in cell wall biosynthesis
MTQRRPTVLFVSPYSVVPPRYGGPLRVYNLCRQLSRDYHVVQFAQQAQRSTINGSLAPVIQQVTPSYLEWSSRNPLNLLLYSLTSLRWNCPPIWQSAALRVSSPRWLRQQARRADLVHVEHPWQFAWVYRQIGRSKPIVLGAPNVEAALYTAEQINTLRPIGCRIVKAIQNQEAFAVTHATRVVAVTAQDAETLVRQHGIAPAQIAVVPNGVDCAKFSPCSEEQRRQRKAELGLAGKHVVLFAGSMHRPNIEAVQQILEWAQRWPDEQTCFLVVGTVGRQFMHIRHPRVQFTGSVVDTRPYFDAADIAVNPMLTGSGSNLKQLEFMAMGLPTLATLIGARGIPIVDGVDGLICSLEQFPAQIRRLLEDAELRAQLGQAGRQLVLRQFDWSVVAEALRAVFVDAQRALPAPSYGR